MARSAWSEFLPYAINCQSIESLTLRVQRGTRSYFRDAKGKYYNPSITLPILSISDSYLGTIEPSISIVLASKIERNGRKNMKPFWFRAAQATNVGVPVRLGAIGAVVLSVGGRRITMSPRCGGCSL